MIVRLRYDDTMDPIEYEVDSIEVQTVDPVQITSAAHGFGIVISEPPSA